ncbi:sulfurtransferase [Marinisporobacter balticus]|uniref:Thiosulfate/3-mercaptopyruvate sulfurtransferase n=1 Tax=Marinisporobacter balticus TaxID=2018667 RepID=A0A4R2L7J2_9FIRM|nr:sulfurtransferase [Marinisporobacter balticus]TCO75195.1 thiosulfate/3-mercaptopyruvate sulfurtransferase [Marinisporobacter balticus]
MKNFINTKCLFENLEKDHIVIVDCRFDLFDPEYGRSVYEAAHVEHAFYLDMNTDLSGEKKEHGGSRPLSDLDVFRKKLEHMGIDNDTTIVIYDEHLDGTPRLWWFLKYLGHEKVYVLNGGMRAWAQQGYPITKEIPKVIKKGKYNIKVDESIFCDRTYVKERKDLDDVILIDARAYERYTGENEPLYKKAGHIPGAINYAWKNNIENGFFKRKEALEKDFKEIMKYEEIIFYCGSGIAACVNCLALNEIGIHSKVYIGSFSDWISYEDHLIATV